MSKYQELLLIGEVIGTHGIDGELKVRPYTESPDNFKSFNSLIVKGKELGIRQSRVYKDKVYLYLERVTKRTTAEKILGENLYINRDQADKLEEDEFYIVDLIGADIIDQDSGEKIGKLSDVKQTGVVDNYEIQLEDKKILVPALKEYFEIVDLNKIIAKIPKEFFEL